MNHWDRSFTPVFVGEVGQVQWLQLQGTVLVFCKEASLEESRQCLQKLMRDVTCAQDLAVFIVSVSSSFV